MQGDEKVFLVNGVQVAAGSNPVAPTTKIAMGGENEG